MARKVRTPEEKEKRRRINFLNACRKAFIFSNTFTNTYLKAQVGKKFMCAICNKLFPKCKMHVDHINPVTPYDKRQYEMTEQEIIERVFVESDEDVRCLCHECHDIVTKEQNKSRTFRKKDKK